MTNRGVLDLSMCPSSLYSSQGMRWLKPRLAELEGAEYVLIHAPKSCGDHSSSWINWLENKADRHLLQKDLGELRGRLREFFSQRSVIGFVEGSVTGSFFDLLLFSQAILTKSTNFHLGFPAAKVGTFPALGGLEVSSIKGVRALAWEKSPTTAELVKKRIVLHNPFASLDWDFQSFVPEYKNSEKKKWFGQLRQSKSKDLPNELGTDSLWSHKSAIYRKTKFSKVHQDEGVYQKLLVSQFFQNKYQSFLSRFISQEQDSEDRRPISVQVAVDSAAIPRRFLKLFFVSPMCRQVYFHAGDTQTLSESVYFLRERYDEKSSGGQSIWRKKASFYVGSDINENIPNFIWSSSGHFVVQQNGEHVQFYHLDPTGSLVEVIDSSENPKQLFSLLKSIGIQNIQVPNLIDGLPLTVLAQSAVFQSLSELSQNTGLPFSFFVKQLKSREWKLAGSLRQWSTFLNRRFLYFSHFRDNPKLADFGLDAALFEKDYVDNLRPKSISDEEASRWNPYRIETCVVKDLAKKIGRKMNHSYKDLGLLSIAAGIPVDSGRLIHELW